MQGVAEVAGVERGRLVGPGGRSGLAFAASLEGSDVLEVDGPSRCPLGCRLQPPTPRTNVKPGVDVCTSIRTRSLKIVISLASTSPADVIAAVPSPASSRRGEQAVGVVGGARQSVDPPITRYLTSCRSNDSNTSCSLWSMFGLRQGRIGCERQVGHEAEVLHPLGQRERLEPPRLGGGRFIFAMVRDSECRAPILAHGSVRLLRVRRRRTASSAS